MIITILGANGFIGSELVKLFSSRGYICNTPTREEIYSGLNYPLGHVIYAIGLTSDYRERPFDTVEAHVSVLNKFIHAQEFESFLYLSSTRIYQNTLDTHEDTSLLLPSSDALDIYNISKLMGESICMNSEKNNVKIVRLANIVGLDFSSNNFLFSLIREALSGHIKLRSAKHQSRDYIHIKDTIAAIEMIMTKGKHSIYNIASGRNISNESIVNLLQKITQCSIELPSSEQILNNTKTININRISTEFSLFSPVEFEKYFEELFYQFKEKFCSQ